MGRTIRLHLGINGEFCAGRWDQPQNWIRLASDMGYPCYEFCTDLIDPFFCGDTEFQLEQAATVKQAAHDCNVQITTARTGRAAERFHGVSHSHPIARQRMVEWVVAAMDIAREMGAEAIGGRWDAIPTEVIDSDDNSYQKAIESKHTRMRELSQIARDKGLRAIYYEQMYDPARTPWTIRQAEEFLIETNRNNSGCHVYLGINVGHMAGSHYGLGGRDVSYVEWLKALGAFAPIIHLQQTTPNDSRYAPLTEGSAEKGHVQMDDVIGAIKHAHANFEESWVSEAMQPVGECWLIVHVIPDPTKTKDKLLSALKQTADYLKQWLPNGHLTIEV